MNNLHVARRLFDILTDCEIAHQLTGVPHHEYLQKRAHALKGQTRKEMQRILDLGPRGVVNWMQIFLAEFEDCLE